MERLQSLIEFTRKEILAGTDPAFIHHKQYTKELPTKNLAGAQYQSTQIIRTGNYKHVEVTFWTGSADRVGSVIHTQKIILDKLFPLLKAKKSELTLKAKVMEAINEGDLRIGCTCEAFLYWGYAYIITQLGAQHPEFAEKRPPKIRNPQQRGIICKHLDLVLHVLPFNATTIVKELRDLGY